VVGARERGSLISLSFKLAEAPPAVGGMLLSSGMGCRPVPTGFGLLDGDSKPAGTTGLEEVVEPKLSPSEELAARIVGLVGDVEDVVRPLGGTATGAAALTLFAGTLETEGAWGV
jgi:hypothetical protein